ncbi:WhiB family transcriptional regulator [Streptomyces longwoodensis]|uniref:WhiB family transcriptional regulator n=1 Tax=Streptomyces longwoodensis TaxID=68231 RepID=UPI002DD99684|nr:WhiB family transcriptional regulator [Streptomyces longwoodensis]WRY87353.1 WhiB family transcriptional regulator [Streptomyces longwoodensis]
MIRHPYEQPAELDDWREQAVCREVDPETFFPEGHESRGDVQRAQAICFTCPVRIQCGQTAIRLGERNGIWGGMTQTQLRTRSRGRRAQQQRSAA